MVRLFWLIDFVDEIVVAVVFFVVVLRRPVAGFFAPIIGFLDAAVEVVDVRDVVFVAIGLC